MTTPLDEMGQALARVMEHANDPAVAQLLGPSYVAELRTTAVGFRQRFPSSWPGSQQPLPLATRSDA